MRCEVVSLKNRHRNILIISYFLYFSFFVRLPTQLLGSPVQNAPNTVNTSSNDGQSSIANIPDTIVALDHLRSSLSDVLDDFKFVAENNQSKANPPDESNTPLTLDDIRNIEHTGDNPLDPSKYADEQHVPNKIPMAERHRVSPDQQHTNPDTTTIKKIAGRNEKEEVCGIQFIILLFSLVKFV